MPCRRLFRTKRFDTTTEHTFTLRNHRKRTPQLKTANLKHFPHLVEDLRRLTWHQFESIVFTENNPRFTSGKSFTVCGNAKTDLLSDNVPRNNCQYSHIHMKSNKIRTYIKTDIQGCKKKFSSSMRIKN